MTTTPYEEPDYEEETPMEHFAGSLTPMHPVSKDEAKKNLKNRNPVGFSR